VACFWVLFAMLAGPGHNLAHWTVVTVTLPAYLLCPTDRPVSWHTVMFLNAGIYLLIGLAVEPLLRYRLRAAAQPNSTDSL
jgi:hypothetical protein